MVTCESDASMNDYGLMPRYRFEPTGVGCGIWGHDRDCLCDVDVTAGIELASRHPVLFADLALNAIGAERLTVQNLAEWASVLLGCHERWRAMSEPDGPQNPEYDSGFDEWDATYKGRAADVVRPKVSKRNMTAWKRLDEKTRTQLKLYASAGVRWKEIKTVQGLALLSVSDLKSVRKHYSEYSAHLRAKARREVENVEDH